MFWKREKKVVNGGLGPLLIHQKPVKREFQTMLEILKDAEKYDNVNDIKVRDVLLTALCEKIELFKYESQKTSIPEDGGCSLSSLG